MEKETVRSRAVTSDHTLTRGIMPQVQYRKFWKSMDGEIGQESLHQDSNDNGVRLVKFATSKNLVVKSTMFPHRNIHKYTWTSPDGKTHNQIDHILIDRR